MTVGVIVNGLDDEQRRQAYAADITYGTNNEFGFDYLRDNMKYDMAQMVQRGHAYAIVDEVDSILVDEARTPLIISGAIEDKSGLYQTIDKFIPRLGPEHFEAHYNLALAYESERRPAEALREIEVSRRLAPDDSDAANTNAIICVENGDTACAQGIWSRLVRLAPDYAAAAENLSILNRSVALAKRTRLNASAQSDDSSSSSAVDALPEIAQSSGIWSK